ncbi:Gx transporter family protein [Anaerostipes sp. MSJ-23]|uniref:Gx transporter family protein n=1 Tax=unclassified Anaerostipes TaxID=2635253 RepID=UPI001C1236D9|nr:Gx transporter family protein [Anaerostipes sp. MSJ-23]MBU5460644.1 Gx transporter family protein [Anaerostipes sp. MSJ-23]
MSTKRLATDGLFLALALVVSYIEVLIPIPIGIPGVKIGLANAVVMVLLFFSTWQRTLIISIMRIFLVGFLFGNPMTIAYSLAGGILSLLVMLLLKKIHGFSTVGISVGGGVAHNIGQLSVAVLLMENARIYYYAPVLLITGTIAGVVIGVLTGILVKKLPKSLFC